MGTGGEEKGHCGGDSSDSCLLRWRSQSVGWGVRYLGVCLSFSRCRVVSPIPFSSTYPGQHAQAQTNMKKKKGSH